MPRHTISDIEADSAVSNKSTLKQYRFVLCLHLLFSPTDKDSIALLIRATFHRYRNSIWETTDVLSLTR